MSGYNPIVRTFNQIRTVILRFTGVERCRVRPDARLADLIPPDQRREVWMELSRLRLKAPGLRLATPTGCLCGLTFVAKLVLLGLWGGMWAGLGLLPLALGLYFATRPLARDLPLSIGTVGELTLYCTHFPSHWANGYRPSRADISLKVRLIVAETLGLPIDQVREDSSLIELGAE